MLNSDSLLSLDEIFNSFCCCFHAKTNFKLTLAKICKIFQDSKPLKLKCVKNRIPPSYSPYNILFKKRIYSRIYITYISSYISQKVEQYSKECHR